VLSHLKEIATFYRPPCRLRGQLSMQRSEFI